jgi:hypothetical protein
MRVAVPQSPGRTINGLALTAMKIQALYLIEESAREKGLSHEQRLSAASAGVGATRFAKDR